MQRLLNFTSLFLFSCVALAKQSSPLYQIDMIVFTHLNASSPQALNTHSPLLAPDTSHALPLQNNPSDRLTPFHILPPSASQLRKEYWALTRKPQYQILFHYTWLQPKSNQQAVALSQINLSGWNIEGTFKIRQSNYYLLDTELLFSAPNSEQTAFVFSQKQRLKPGVTYYLDHPQAGMLIKINPLT